MRNTKPTPDTKAHDVLQGVFNEWRAASRKFPRFNSPHEGFAVLLEEVEELKAEVFKGGTSPRSHTRMRQEATQVAAMAIRFLTDCCEDDAPKYPTDSVDSLWVDLGGEG